MSTIKNDKYINSYFDSKIELCNVSFIEFVDELISQASDQTEKKL